MRRSFREAAVGLSIVAALVFGSGFWLRLRGHQFLSNSWTITVHLEDAAGLVSRSNVLYRGVEVGKVQSIKPESEFVAVHVQISDQELVIAQPVRAQVFKGSLLGGTAQLVLRGPSKPWATTLAAPTSPTSEHCPSEQQLCAGAVLQGTSGATLDAAVAKVTQLLDQAIELDLLTNVDQTMEGLLNLSASLMVTVENGNGLVRSFQELVQDLSPTVDHVNTSTANLSQMTHHLANVAGELDSPETIAQFRQILANAENTTNHLSSRTGTILANVEALIARLEHISGDIEELTSDPAVTEGLRNVAVGLGLLFKDIYGAERLANPNAAEGGPEP